MKIKITADRKTWRTLRCPVCGNWLEPDFFDEPPKECTNCNTEIEYEDGEQE